MARQPFSTVNPTPEKRLEGNAPSPALGAYRGRSGSLLPSSHRHCFQRQGDWLTNHRSEAFTLHPQTAQDKLTLGLAQWTPPCLEPELPTMTPRPLFPRWTGAEGAHAGLSPPQGGVPTRGPPLWLTGADRGPRGRGPWRRPWAAENGWRALKHGLAPPDRRRSSREGSSEAEAGLPACYVTSQR